MKKPTALIILDGYGIARDVKQSAIDAAATPVMDKLMKTCPHNIIHASGMDVGLPDGQMGNSEVGHTNIGAGRIVYQELTRITKSIKDGDFFTNEAFKAAIENVKKSGGALHLMGLLSDGGVHSHNTHLYALIELAKREGIDEVYVHCFLDGRDVGPTTGADFVKELEDEMKKIGTGKVATVMGRYYAMDRDNRWERVKKAYDAIVNGEGIKAADAESAVRESYKNDVTDEFVVPTVIDGAAKLKEGGYRAGIWVRDSAAGIGTLTFYLPSEGRFAGLGHAVCDVDTGQILPLRSGEIVNVLVTGVVRGRAGRPGELTGTFAGGGNIGVLEQNNSMGIYGRMDAPPEGMAAELALRNEVSVGPATIFATVEGAQAKEYAVYIEKVNLTDRNPTKNIVIRIDDQELLEKTGGIVQGMSGCPIMQNGKLVGAVTHVFVNDPTRGYGIFAENMLDNIRGDSADAAA